MSELGEAQARLNKIVKIIADSMNSEVCSIYLINRHNILELYATEGLRSKAVHYSQLNVGQGLVGKIAATAEPIKTSQASKTKDLDIFLRLVKKFIILSLVFQFNV